MPEAIKVSAGEFNSLLGLDATKHSNPTQQPDDVSIVSRFSPSEVQAFYNRTYVKPQQQGSNVSPEGIISYLKPIHSKIGNNRLSAEKLKALAPEIEQSRILVSSSIMSPNDLQDGKFIFKFHGVPALEADPTLLDEITKLFEQHFNETLQLGVRSYDWIGDVQYGSGSKCILILPEASHEELRHRKISDRGSFLDGEVAFESFKEAELKSQEYLYSGRSNSWRDYLNKTNTHKQFEAMIPSMESFGVQVPTKYSTSRKSLDSHRYGDDYVRGLEEMIINLKTKLSEGDAIRITEDSDVFRFYSKNNTKKQETIMDKLAAKYGFDEIPDREEVTYLSANPKEYDHHGHPTIIELPSEAVIPIVVPGAPSEHLGYFVLLDGHGMPLTIEASGMGNMSTECQSGSPNGAFEAMFGSNCTNAQYFSVTNSKNNAGEMMFTHLLDGYIKSRMQGIFGRDDLTLSRFNSLSTVLFYRLLEAKSSTLVFVPPVLLHYFAFDYDPKDGTGRSKTSEIQFLLSLRTTLMMANVVAMVNDAIEHKKVEFGVDEKVANIEGMMDLIANIFIEKNKLTGSVDPSEIMRNMYSNALTIVPKNVPGLSDLSVEVQSGGGQSSRVDDSLLEQLTNLLVSHLDVPPAALNQMSEPEFAKSLVTYNLFFAKKIRRYQRIWCAHMTRFMRAYIAFDPVLKKAIAVKLSANIKKSTNDKVPGKVKKLLDNNPNEYSSVTGMINAIAETFTVELASPNIVVDKTQFEELRSFLDNLDALADRFFNNELVPSEDNLAQSALPVVKALWKQKQTSRFLSEVGSFNMVDIPDVDDFDPEEPTTFIQMLQNAGAALQKQREAITPDGEGSGSGFGDGGYSGEGDESSGSDDFGDEGGDDFGGDLDGSDDLDMGDESAEESIDESSEESFDTGEIETEEKPDSVATMYAKMFSIGDKFKH